MKMRHLLTKLTLAWKHRFSACRRMLKKEPLQKSPPSEGSHQAALTGLALTTRDSEAGCTAVRRIQVPFLLRRIATSARQDSVRLAAALRLDHADLIASISQDVDETPHHLAEETES